MVPLLSLWLPILLSAVIVFIVSSILHMVFTYHENDFKKIPDEEIIMDDLRKYSVPPGEYMMPNAGSYKASKTPEFAEKLNKGPVAIISVMPGGQPKMGKSLFLWFIYILVVSVFAAYVAGRALSVDASYLSVFRFTGVTAFVGFALALWQGTIWFNRSWKVTLKSTFDGLVYALFTAGTFGWLWPN